MSVRELLIEAERTLAAGGIEAARPEAELIVGHVLGESRGRVQALSVLGTVLDEPTAERVRELAAERAQRVPLQHLTGTAPFRGIELAVGPGVFVPRPETEGVVQHAVDELLTRGEDAPQVVDLCTGSGAIALAIAQEVPTSRVLAVEKSREAHAWASRNVDHWGDGRVTLILGDVTKDIDELSALEGQVDLLVSNPPYVPNDMVPREPEVRDHDPSMALYGGADGLDLVRVISALARRLVRANGALVLEHAEAQGAAIRRILAEDGWESAVTHQDLTGRDRSTTARARAQR